MESHLYFITVVYTEMVTGLEKCIKLIVVLLNIINTKYSGVILTPAVKKKIKFLY